MENYAEAMDLSQSEGKSIHDSFALTNVNREYEDMYGWLDFILEENVPLYAIEKKRYRKFSQFESVFTYKRMKETISHLAKICESSLEIELKEAGRGAIMYDGWSKAGVHYIGIFGCYCRETYEVMGGVKTRKSSPEISLLFCSPIYDVIEITENMEVQAERASSFNADLHSKHFRHVFEQDYNIDLDSWVECAIADNTSTNKKIARLLQIPHVPCANHLLNLDMKSYLTDEEGVTSMIDQICDVMKQAKSLTNAAVLTRYTAYKPVLPNVTRWSSTKEALSRFVKIYDALVRTADDCDSDLVMNESIAFKRKAEKHLRYFIEIDTVTKVLQERKMLLEETRMYLDELIEEIEDNSRSRNHIFHDCKFKPTRIKLTHTFLHPDASFESGVVKIQRNREDTLTDYEHLACQSLKIPSTNVFDSEDDDGFGENDDGDGFVVRRAKMRRRNEIKLKLVGKGDGYGDCNFIYGSVAEVERLWSIAKHILTDERKGRMDTNMFQNLLFFNE